jgi:FkbM family methyltransferase
MKSDNFRLAYLYMNGGAYLDADEKVLSALPDIDLSSGDRIVLSPIIRELSSCGQYVSISPTDLVGRAQVIRGAECYFANSPLLVTRKNDIIGIALIRATRLILQDYENGERSDIHATTGPTNLTLAICAYLLHSACTSGKRCDLVVLDWSKHLASHPARYKSDRRNWRVTERDVGKKIPTQRLRELGARDELKAAEMRCHQPHRSYHSYLEQLGNLHSNVFFVEIGAGDGKSFDLLHPFITRFHWAGILVEPLADVYAELVSTYQGHSNLRFENAAVSESAEKQKMYRIPIGAVASGAAPDWAVGISSLYRDRNALGGHRVSSDDYRRIQHLITETEVNCIPFDRLVTKHGVDRIDVLQIDTEGHDYHILKQVDFSRFLPILIYFEAYNLPANELAASLELLKAHGYTCYRYPDDILAVQQSMLPDTAADFDAPVYSRKMVAEALYRGLLSRRSDAKGLHEKCEWLLSHSSMDDLVDLIGHFTSSAEYRSAAVRRLQSELLDPG